MQLIEIIILNFLVKTFKGAQEVFQHLPHEYVSPAMLPKIAKHGDLNKLYACEVNHS